MVQRSFFYFFVVWVACELCDKCLKGKIVLGDNEIPIAPLMEVYFWVRAVNSLEEKAEERKKIKFNSNSNVV